MPHLRAIMRDVRGHVAEQVGEKPINAEGRADTRWVVLDYINVMVHIMDTELREFYGLEELWSDAKVIQWEGSDLPS